MKAENTKIAENRPKIEVESRHPFCNDVYSIVDGFWSQLGGQMASKRVQKRVQESEQSVQESLQSVQEDTPLTSAFRFSVACC